MSLHLITDTLEKKVLYSPAGRKALRLPALILAPHPGDASEDNISQCKLGKHAFYVSGFVA